MAIVPKELNIHYLLGILNSKIVHFIITKISPFVQNRYFNFSQIYIERLPIRLPQTLEEKTLALQISGRVEQILTKAKYDQRTSRFPEEYIKEYRARGEEFDGHEISFNVNHKELSVDIEKSLDKEFVLKIKGIAPMIVDSESKAEYLKAALTGRKVTKGEKIQVLVPRNDSLAKEAVVYRKKDMQDAQGIKTLEDEINELVYKLYGLDENDKKEIDGFLSKF